MEKAMQSVWKICSNWLVPREGRTAILYLAHWQKPDSWMMMSPAGGKREKSTGVWADVFLDTTGRLLFK